jgi:hypothetical protein
LLLVLQLASLCTVVELSCPVALPLQEVPRLWSNQPYNFDHLGMAMVSLFVTATLNGYTGARQLALVTSHALVSCALFTEQGRIN